MPIITAAYPSMCATHTVTASTLSILTSEFKRAADNVEQIFRSQADWPELFQKTEFFTLYRRDLRVMAMSDAADKQLKHATAFASTRV